MLDATDRQILTLLQQDAFISNKELSQRLNLSLTPIHERVKRLEREGYLRGYVGLVDRKKIGRDLIAFCQVSLKEHTQDFIHEFEARIGSLPEVVECYNIAGPFDYLLKVVVKDMDDYRRFVVGQLAALAHIGGPQSLFVMAEIKATTALPIDG